MTAKESEKTGFGTLKVSEGNRKAVEAARAVVGGSADGNPLVLIGQEGAGKTTLLQAIVEGVAAQKDGRRVLTLTMGKFRPHYIAAKKACALRRFRERMRDAEVLIVDEFETANLGCLIQEELIALMMSYLYAGKQLVIASSVPLSQIRGSSRTNIRLARFAEGKTVMLE